MEEGKLREIISHFKIEGSVESIRPLGNGLINETLKVETSGTIAPDYVLQRINNAVFENVELLQHNIEIVTCHIRKKLQEKGVSDIERKCLRFIEAENGKTYYKDADGKYWRMSVLIPDSVTKEAVNTESAYDCGRTFGDFEFMLSDVKEPLGETIPHFHDVEFRLRQLQDAVHADVKKRADGVKEVIKELLDTADEMGIFEDLHRKGALPARINHCDTKVNNILFDASGQVLCVIDLDTVMPSYVFSDFGDYLRSCANNVAEDSPNFHEVGLNEDIFKAFTKGYVGEVSRFLVPAEKENMYLSAALFPYMQAVRFLWDYLCGDHYWKCNYEEHNLVRAKNQLALYKDVMGHEEMIKNYIKRCL